MNQKLFMTTFSVMLVVMLTSVLVCLTGMYAWFISFTGITSQTFLIIATTATAVVLIGTPRFYIDVQANKNHLIVFYFVFCGISALYFNLYYVSQSQQAVQNEQIKLVSLAIQKINTKMNAEYNAFDRLFERINNGTYVKRAQLDNDIQNYLNGLNSIKQIYILSSIYGKHLSYPNHVKRDLILKQCVGQFSLASDFAINNTYLCFQDKARKILLMLDGQLFLTHLTQEFLESGVRLIIKYKNNELLNQAKQIQHANIRSINYKTTAVLRGLPISITVTQGLIEALTPSLYKLVQYNIFIFILFICLTVVVYAIKILQEKHNAVDHLASLNELILNSAGDALFGLNNQHKVTFMNPAAEKLSGYSVSELLHKDLHNKLYYAHADGSEYPHDANPIFKTITTGQSYSIKNEVIWRKDGAYIWVEYTCTPIYHQGCIEGAVVAIRDVSKEHELNQLREEMIASINHELRTPLTSIKASIWYLMKSLVDRATEKETDILNSCYASSKRLAALINDMLLTSQITEDKIPFEFELFDIHESTSALLSQYEHLSSESKNTIQFQSDLERPFMMNLDKKRYEQIITNLLSNAMKYSYDHTEIEVKLYCEYDELVFYIKNESDGIPDRFKQQIFDKFTRVDASSTREKPGTGLGLYITRSLVEGLGGTITFRSTPNETTEFFVKFQIYA